MNSEIFINTLYTLRQNKNTAKVSLRQNKRCRKVTISFSFESSNSSEFYFSFTILIHSSYLSL